jgi:CDP-glucose 4,6-dehydratase
MAVTYARGGTVSPEFWRSQRVLVTGHTGFKGGWLTVWLLGLGAEVTGLALAPDASPNMFEALALAKRVRHHVVDVRDRSAVARVIDASAPTILFHLAAQPLVRRSYVQPVETYETNVLGTINVLDAARSCQSLRAVVCVTSDKCYENREWEWGYRENEPMGGFDPYSSSKACAEIAIAAYRRSFFASGAAPAVASARAGNVIGGGDWSPDRLIPDAVRALVRGDRVAVRNPQAQRPWQHVIEPLRGYLALAEACSADRAFAEGWNFGPADVDALRVGTLLDRVVALWGEGAGWEHTPDGHAPHEARLLKLECSKAQARLGWRPRIPLETALEMTIEWYRRHARGAPPDVLSELTWQQIARYGMVGEAERA